jgi:hypothetical protein
MGGRDLTPTSSLYSPCSGSRVVLYTRFPEDTDPRDGEHDRPIENVSVTVSASRRVPKPSLPVARRRVTGKRARLS